MATCQIGPGLRGRRRECDELDRVIRGVTASQSQVLVVRGEAGVGKTVLLNYLAMKASACRTVRAAGIESELDLPYAGVHQLCASMLHRLSALPVPQRDALGTAFGLSAGEVPDRFRVGLAVLNLISEAAEEQPVLCVVDDVQWLDRASAQVLAFVARRLLAERVGLVLAIREPSDRSELDGLPALIVGGLGDDDARELLEWAVPGRLDERVRDRIVAETHGNPLALLELPRGWSAEELAGGFGLPDARPLASRIEQSFVRRLQSLPVETQRLLLTAAADPLGDVALLARAAQGLGIRMSAAEPAVGDGLIELGTRVRFSHPLVRSAVYRAASLPERQAVHRALAAATDAAIDPDRRAWHLAHAAVGPDEEVANELTRSADRARRRGGVAAAAAFVARATELTPDPIQRGARALAAAQAKFDCAAHDAASELLTVAEMGPLDDLQRARIARLRAQIVFARSRGSDAPPLLLDAAQRVGTLDAGLARQTYLEALGAAVFAGRLGGRCGVRDIAEVARAGPPGPEPQRPMDLLLDGLATRFTAGYAAGVPAARRAVSAFRREVLRGEDDSVRGLWLAWLVAGDLWDDEAWHELATRAVGLAREAGALTVLPVTLQYRAGVHIHEGEFAAASELDEEADAISSATGNAPLRYSSLVLSSWGGDEARTSKLIEDRTRDAMAKGEGRAIGLVTHCRAVLYNGLGRYEVALAAARQACDYDDLVLSGWSLVELVEAGARSGAHGAAAAALRQLEEHTRAAGTDWGLGVLARSRALLSSGDDADALYREAIERLGRCRIVVHLARSHLVYGEWLRRENRRADARAQLRAAHEKLSGMGAEAFAERARRELLATGETVRKRASGPHDALTAQETQIARLAVGGRTNPEIGSQLFISARTVEYHLHKVFAKLGIGSRRELRDVLPAGLA